MRREGEGRVQGGHISLLSGSKGVVWRGVGEEGREGV